jgi:hypothetical protein
MAEGDARVIVDGDVDEVPARALVAAFLARAGRPVAWNGKTAELVDVDVQHLAGARALWPSPAHRRTTLQYAHHGF